MSNSRPLFILDHLSYLISSNFQTLQSLIATVRKLGKTAYLFSVDTEGGKVNHVNVVSEQHKSSGLDAQQWAASVSGILGGKVSQFLSVSRLYT